MSKVILVLAFLAVCVSSKSASVSVSKDEVTAFGGGQLTLTMKYSRIGSTEARSNFIDFPTEDGRSLQVGFGIKHASDSRDAKLQLKFYTKIADGRDYSIPANGRIGIVKTSGEIGFSLQWKQTFSTSNPDSKFYNLLSKNVLLDPSNGYYDQANDQLRLSVPFQF